MRAEPFADSELRRDAFLGGRVQLWQPVSGYRAGIDPVLLAATVEARSGESVLELGCGAGPALCCLGARVPGLDLVGLEIQPAYADLARRNLAENGLPGEVLTGDISAPPGPLKQLGFHHVIANPPYFEADARSRAEDDGRELALAGKIALADWIGLAARRLRPKGIATFIQRAERLPEMICAMEQSLGSLELWPLAPREGRAPRLILLRGRKGGKAQFRLHPALMLHEGASHLEDGEDYTNVVKAVLRDGNLLKFPA